MNNEHALPVAEAAPQLGLDPQTLKKRCQRGRVPGAYKILDGKLEKWFIPIETMQSLQDDSGQSEYDTLYAEWIRCMERGLGYKKPVSPRGVEANLYGIEKFWLFVEDPPTVIKSGRRKGELKAMPKRTPNIKDITLDNLRVSLSNVPLDRIERKCHFSLKEKMYNGFRSFFKFLVYTGQRSRADLADLVDVKPVRIYEEKREYLTESQLLDLLEKNENLITGRHDADYDAMGTKVIIMLAALAGLRLEDIELLEVNDIDLARQELLVVDGKGNKSREVGFNDEVRDTLTLWLTKFRPKTKLKQLLISDTGKPFTSDMIYKRLRRLGTAPHVLRRTCASIALEKGVPLHHISEMFGHTRTSTTEKSYVKVSRQKAKASFKALSIGTGDEGLAADTIGLIDSL